VDEKLGASLGADGNNVDGVADIASSGELRGAGELVDEAVGDEPTLGALGFKVLVGVATATAGKG
jgi:hypothetical protein